MDAPWRTSRQALFQYLDRIVAFNWREAMACHEPSHTRFALSHRIGRECVLVDQPVQNYDRSVRVVNNNNNNNNNNNIPCAYRWHQQRH